MRFIAKYLSLKASATSDISNDGFHTCHRTIDSNGLEDARTVAKQYQRKGYVLASLIQSQNQDNE